MLRLRNHLFAALLLCACGLQWLYAADLHGPFNNTQTVVEYTVVSNPAATWLYALNTKDKPVRNITGNDFCMLNRTSDNSGEWSEFLNIRYSGGNPFYPPSAFPHILGRNATTFEGASVCMTIAGYAALPNRIGISKRGTGNGAYWWERNPINPPGGELRHTRMAVSRLYPSVQWMGFDWSQALNWNARFVTTTDGWANLQSNAHYLAGGNLPPWTWDYSLAIDDLSDPTHAVCVLSDERSDWEGINQPHFRYTHCGSVYYTINGNDPTNNSWAELSVPGWTVNDNMYNVQVAMVPTTDNADGPYRLYFVGLKRDPLPLQILSTWADWNTNNTFTWSSQSFTTDVEEGTEDVPTFPFDLVVERSGNTYYLLLATSEKIYYAAHVGSDPAIPWETRMGSGTNAIHTRGFFDITVHPSDRLNTFAVAGDECSHFTVDAGVSWTSILQPQLSNQIATPVSGALQGSDGVTDMRLLSIQRGNPSGQNASIAPVYVERMDHQSGGSEGMFNTPSHVGYSYQPGQFCSPSPLLTLSTVDHRYYVAFTDHHTVSGNSTHGISYYSDDEGLTWAPSTWPSRQFSLDAANCLNPQPSRLAAHPSESNKLYMTFLNSDQGTGVEDIPAFAYSNDGGASWQYALGAQFENLPSTKLLAVGNDGITTKVYVYAGGLLYVAQDPDFDNWMSLPGAPNDGIDLAVKPDNPNRVTIATGSYFVASGDGGLHWGLPMNIPQQYDGYTIKGIQPIVENNSAFWVTLNRESTGDWKLIVVKPITHSWFEVNSVTDGMIASMDMLVEPKPVPPTGPAHSRVFWTVTGVSTLGGATQDPTQVRYHEVRILRPIDYTIPITPEMPALAIDPVEVPVGETMIIQPGSHVILFPGAEIVVDGTLQAGSNSGAVTVFESVNDNDASQKWPSVTVKGSATIENCKISGASTAVKLMNARGSVTLSSNEITGSDVGLYVYDNSLGAPQLVEDCNIHNNSREGVSLLASKKITLTNNTIQDNGGDGVLISTGQATLNENTIHTNGSSVGGYGLTCYGSSPILYCNDFLNNNKGEMGLFNQSYPVLWSSGGTSGGGVNSFLNTTKSLIVMVDAYPIVKGGHNNFRLGASGYFMEDNSAFPKKRDISDNYWSPRLDINLLWPKSTSVYTWTSTDPVVNNCGTGAGTIGGPGALFVQGVDAEITGDISTAQTAYSEVITQYPDSEWSSAAAARLFQTQCDIDSGYGALQTYLNNVATTSEDTVLVKSAEVLATRLWVEGEQYDPAFSVYEETMTNPPSEVDSAFAAIDYAITGVRAQMDSSSLDSYYPAVPVSTVSERIRGLVGVVPQAPATTHEGYTLDPTRIALDANYPNPFNAVTSIRYFLPAAATVRLEVFNIMGQRVATLVHDNAGAGYHTVSWNSHSWPSGVYVYRLEADGHGLSHKMLLLK